MPHFSCIIQSGQAADSEQAEKKLEVGLHEVQEAFLQQGPATFSWLKVPPGYMFSEGRPSTLSVVALSVADETTLRQRGQLMKAVCDLWQEVTGCSDHEVLVAITKTDLFAN